MRKFPIARACRTRGNRFLHLSFTYILIRGRPLIPVLARATNLFYPLTSAVPLPPSPQAGSSMIVYSLGCISIVLFFASFWTYALVLFLFPLCLNIFLLAPYRT